MKVAVAGGTGVAGRQAVAALRGAGHEPVVLSRSTGVELVSGAGLDEALTGVDTVIDASNISAQRAAVVKVFFEATSRNLMRAAARGGVRHIVALSIIGIDHVPYGYYQGKVRQEEVLRDSQVPVSILRAAQFHEFPGQYLEWSSSRLVIVPKWRVQPVAAREVGDLLARLAVGAPVPMTQLAGPTEERMADLIRQVLVARGERRQVLEVRLPGTTGRALATGDGLPGPGVTLGTQTFADWLRSQAQHPSPIAPASGGAA
ncbi:MAG TPA: NAD(P)H-binding protein [Trebonia sp.]|nr:NAD(P)H-binding protein [Trebonia sp.]